MDPDLQGVFALIDASTMSQEDKTFVKASAWTHSEVAPIKSAAQYEVYGRMIQEIERSASLPDRSSPEFGEAFVQYARTRTGILATSLGARMIEWEERAEK